MIAFQTDSTQVASDISELIADCIPEYEWDRVRRSIVERIVNEMPSDVMLQLTNSAEDFDLAELILNAHYKEVPNVQLIVDAFNLIGSEQTADLLDSLNIQDGNGFPESNPS